MSIYRWSKYKYDTFQIVKYKQENFLIVKYKYDNKLFSDCKKGRILYSAVSSHFDRSKRITLCHLADLFIPTPTCLLWEVVSHAVYCAKTIHSHFHHCI